MSTSDDTEKTTTNSPWTNVRVSVVTGRNTLAVNMRLAELQQDGATTISHPWTDLHPADGARAFRSMCESDPGYYAVFTFQGWIVEVLGDLIYRGLLRPDQVDVYLEEDEGESLRVKFDAEGVLESNWRFGYFSHEAF